MKLFRCAVLPCIAILSLAGADLNNEAIIRMVNAGISEDVILTAVNTEPGTYSLSAEDIIKLKENKVSDTVIAAMLKRNGAPSAKVEKPEPAPIVPEIGAYLRTGDAWVDIKPEVVNWKTGGAVKHVGSFGVVKGDLNGLINGASSPTETKTPVQILIYTVEGVGATEYQLVRLHQHNDSREFRTVTGGVFHQSEGAMRDIVPFDSQKVAPRTYKITLTNLSSGQYGLLPPLENTEHSNRAAAALGKIYTFRVVE